MPIHQMAALHARAMPGEHALTIALLESPDCFTFEWSPGEPMGADDRRSLWDACRALLYPCAICETAKPPTDYSRDSAGCGGLCEACYDDAGLENEHADGFHDDEPSRDCPDCRALAA